VKAWQPNRKEAGRRSTLVHGHREIVSLVQQHSGLYVSSQQDKNDHGGGCSTSSSSSAQQLVRYVQTVLMPE
jgi:hypothetical protein